MTREEAVALALAEVERASAKFPWWPDDPIHALAILQEEVGELEKAVLQSAYEPAKQLGRTDVRDEAVQVAAMSLRFLMSLDRYRFLPSDHHRQVP